MSPAKCGSRFLDSIWDTKQRFIPQQLLTELPKTDYIVIRNPYEHLVTALHTDLLHIWNGQWEGQTEESIINGYSTDEGGSHYWLKLYKTLYEYWEATNKTAKIILLHQLNDFIDKKGIEYSYEEDSYNWKGYFEIYKSKGEVMEYVIKKYPTEYGIMMKGILEEQQYYHNFLDTLVYEKLLHRDTNTFS